MAGHKDGAVHASVHFFFRSESWRREVSYSRHIQLVGGRAGTPHPYVRRPTTTVVAGRSREKRDRVCL